MQQPLVARQDFEPHLREHRAAVGNHRSECDVVHPCSQELRRLVPFEFHRQRERRLDEPVCKIRGRCGDVLLKRARDALPFRRLERGRRILHAKLETARRADGHEAALQIHIRDLHPAQRDLRRLRRHRRLVARLQKIPPDHAAVQLHLPRLHPVVHRLGHREKIRDLIAGESHVLRVRRQRDVENLQPRVFDLVLQVCRDLHLRLANRRVLQARHLHPRVHLLDIERKIPRRLQNAERQDALLLDARLLRVELRDAFARRHLQSHPLLRHHDERPALLARLAENQLRRGPSLRRLHAYARERDCKFLPPLGAPAQMQRDDPLLVRLQFRPVAQRLARDGFDIHPRRQREAEAKNSGARDVHRGVHREHRAVFAE